MSIEERASRREKEARVSLVISFLLIGVSVLLIVSNYNEVELRSECAKLRTENATLRQLLDVTTNQLQAANAGLESHIKILEKTFGKRPPAESPP